MQLLLQPWRPNFYPRPPRGGRLSSQLTVHSSASISIHALREEGDIVFGESLPMRKNFYPRPPRGGRHPITGTPKTNRNKFLSTPSARRATCVCPGEVNEVEFLSTPSARRATCVCPGEVNEVEFLSTPSARRATPQCLEILKDGYTISIHALREEGDIGNSVPLSLQVKISIHALREEGDLYILDGHGASKVFLSTPSARRATIAYAQGISQVLFLSTPSARRATKHSRHAGRNGSISIHALREEGDSTRRAPFEGGGAFLSTPSARRATPALAAHFSKLMPFLSTPSARRATSALGISCRARRFLSTPSARRATSVLSLWVNQIREFLSTPSARRATLYSSDVRGMPSEFLSTPSARRATIEYALALYNELFLSTPSARRATW